MNWTDEREKLIQETLTMVRACETLGMYNSNITYASYASYPIGILKTSLKNWQEHFEKMKKEYVD